MSMYRIKSAHTPAEIPTPIAEATRVVAPSEAANPHSSSLKIRDRALPTHARRQLGLSYRPAQYPCHCIKMRRAALSAHPARTSPCYPRYAPSIPSVLRVPRMRLCHHRACHRPYINAHVCQCPCMPTTIVKDVAHRQDIAHRQVYAHQLAPINRPRTLSEGSARVAGHEPRATSQASDHCARHRYFHPRRTPTAPPFRTAGPPQEEDGAPRDRHVGQTARSSCPRSKHALKCQDGAPLSPL
ncbi:hypothetical protein PENSPDRAFT_60166 [Peniophora sp. CONT]|nr:hypothetical protein PENSPDRAFT_60166 [Peniophora sp. CONT]